MTVESHSPDGECSGATITAVPTARSLRRPSTMSFRSRGGVNSWENLVACCRECNNRKGNRSLAEIGWKLSFHPQEPRTGQFWMRGIDKPVEQWRPFLELSKAA